MKLYALDRGVYGLIVCVASSMEEAQQIIADNSPYGKLCDTEVVEEH